MSARCQPSVASGAKERVGWWQATYAPGALNSPRVSGRREPRGEHPEQSARPAECEASSAAACSGVRPACAAPAAAACGGRRGGLPHLLSRPESRRRRSGRHPPPRTEREGASGCARSGGATVACYNGVVTHDAVRNRRACSSSARLQRPHSRAIGGGSAARHGAAAKVATYLAASSGGDCVSTSA